MRHIIKTTLAAALFSGLLLASVNPCPAALGLFEEKSMSQAERAETLERIQKVQEKLQLLQEKLRALERRKAAQQENSEDTPPRAVNWQPVDEAGVPDDQFGVYTYLLFAGGAEDTTSVGLLEELILTIETLPESEPPAGLGNRFLVPVELQQSTVDLGYRPYNFTLSKKFLGSLQLSGARRGPVLVTVPRPIDPLTTNDQVPALVVDLGNLPPEMIRQLLQRWHQYEAALVEENDPPLAGLFVTLLQDAGPTRVDVAGKRLQIAFETQ